jgi:hypothetical protein
MNFLSVTEAINQMVSIWEDKLIQLPQTVITEKQNSQNRTVKQIVGHMVDSASNNTHRIIHMQYQQSPLIFPNYASNGNNDRWINIQNYQNEDWINLVQLWKYSHLHWIHVVNNVNANKLDCEWISGSEEGNIKLRDMITDFRRHFELHINQVEELIN